MLIGFNFSKHCEETIHLGLELAIKLNFEVLILHVDPTPLCEGDVPGEIEIFYDKEKREKRKIQFNELIDKRKKLFSKFPININWILKFGEPAIELNRFADEENVDLLLLGVHEASKFPFKLKKSLVWNLMNLSKRPILILKGDSPKIFAHIFAGIEASSTNKDNMIWVEKISQCYDSRVTAGQIILPTNNKDEVLDSAQLRAVKSLWQWKKEARIKKFNYFTEVSLEETKGKIFLKHLIKENPDLLVIERRTRKKTTNTPQIKKDDNSVDYLIRRCPCSILILPKIHQGTLNMELNGRSHAESQAFLINNVTDSTI
jgi:nucleotide-binding universal stress UspA family protein